MKKTEVGHKSSAEAAARFCVLGGLQVEEEMALDEVTDKAGALLLSGEVCVQSLTPAAPRVAAGNFASEQEKNV